MCVASLPPFYSLVARSGVHQGQCVWLYCPHFPSSWHYKIPLYFSERCTQLYSREGSYYGRDVGLLLHLPHSLSRAHTAFWKSFDRVSLALPGVDLIPPPAVAVFLLARSQCVEFFLDCVMSMTPGEIFFLCYRGTRGYAIVEYGENTDFGRSLLVQSAALWLSVYCLREPCPCIV